VKNVGALPGRAKGLRAGDPKTWRRAVPTEFQVRDRQRSPGIDLVYYAAPCVPGGLEDDFTVAPGATSPSIRLSFSGASLRYS
jgi:hypothetical protein